MAQTAGVIRGRIMKLFIGTAVLEDQLDSTLELTRDVDETTTKDSGEAKTFDYGRYTGTGTVSGYLAFDATEGVTQAIADLKDGTSVVLLWDTETSLNATYSSSALITNASVTFPNEGIATYSFSYQFTGAFTESVTA